MAKNRQFEGTNAELALLVGEAFTTPYIYPNSSNRLIQTNNQNDEIKPFSLFRCFSNPDEAQNAKICKNVAICRIGYGKCDCIRNIFKQTTNSFNLDSFTRHHSSVGMIEPNYAPVKNIAIDKISVGTSPPISVLLFTILQLNNEPVYRTRVTTVPGAWDDVIEIEVPNLCSRLTVDLYDKDFGNDNSLTDAERLSSFRIDLKNLSFCVPYSLIMEATVQLPQSIPLAVAYEKAKNWTENDAKDPCLMDTIVAQVHESESVTLKLNVKIEIIPTPTTSKFAALWGATALELYGNTTKHPLVNKIDAKEFYEHFLILKYVILNMKNAVINYFEDIVSWKYIFKNIFCLSFLIAMFLYKKYRLHILYLFSNIFLLDFIKYLQPIQYAEYMPSNTEPSVLSSLLKKQIKRENMHNYLDIYSLFLYYTRKIESAYNNVRTFKLLSWQGSVCIFVSSLSLMLNHQKVQLILKVIVYLFAIYLLLLRIKIVRTLNRALITLCVVIYRCIFKKKNKNVIETF